MNTDGPILVTGSRGLIGTALVAALRAAGRQVIGIDVRSGADIVKWLEPGDPGLGDLLGNVVGVVHLAGVSRVVDGQRDPAACWRGNVGLSAAIIAAVRDAPMRPWLIQASSREVLGQPVALPADDDTPVAPVNVYGAAKAAAVQELALSQGLVLAECWGYSDSANDIPLLEVVGHPVAINPDRRLRRHAKERDWPIYDFRTGRKAASFGLKAAGVSGVLWGLWRSIGALRRRR